MKFSPYGHPIPLVFAGKFHPEILKVPRVGRQTREWWYKISSFLSREYLKNGSRYG